MRTWFAKPLCLLALLACASLAYAQAQTPVYHCIGAHGEPVFSGQPCGSPAPRPGIAGVQGNGFGDVCPASPEALRQAIAGAFQSQDVNRLAGLILWRGMGQASARAMLQSLSDWLKQPLAGITVAYAAGPPFADTGPAPATTVFTSGPGNPAPFPGGFEISTGGGDGSTRDFGITEFGGCWWLTFD